MCKTLTYSSIAAALLTMAVPSQAREISVWGNNFTVDDGPAALRGAPVGSRFGATVTNPERLMRRHQRLDDLN